MIYADVAKRQWVFPEVLHVSSSLPLVFLSVLGVSPPRLSESAAVSCFPEGSRMIAVISFLPSVPFC